MSKVFLVSNFSNIPLFVVNSKENLEDSITRHYQKFIGNNGKGKCHSIIKGRNGYVVNVTFIDKNNSIHSSNKIYKISEVDSY